MTHESSITSVAPGVESKGNVSPEQARLFQRRRRARRSVDEYVDGILSGTRTTLAQAITLLESTLPRDRDTAEQVIERVLARTGDSLRVGITGVPGVGKSTFIEALGLHLTET